MLQYQVLQKTVRESRRANKHDVAIICRLCALISGNGQKAWNVRITCVIR
jgi:hypothetical protein